MRRCRAGRVVVGTVVAVSVLLAAVVVGTPAQAETMAAHRRGGAPPPIDVDLSATLCPEQTTVAPESGGRGEAKALTGPVTGSIGLVTGDLTVALTERGRPSRDHVEQDRRARGTWRLDPGTSTGWIEGWALVSRRGQVRLTGWGRGSLRGVVLVARSTLDPADDSVCPGGLVLVGAGKVRPPRSRPARGAVEVVSTRTFDGSVEALAGAIEANPGLTLIRTVDHQAAAAGRGLALGPTTELFFGNPAIGTPLMQASQTTGIDLPQKILIWEDLFGTVRVAYNAPSYLRSRHGIEGADAQLTTVANALAALAGEATGTEVEAVFDAGEVRAGAGLVSVASERSPEDAFAAIVAALEAAPPVNVAIVLEHDANAAQIGLLLDPTKLVVFGNPSLGTGLMQADQSVALDLPQKMLVYAGDDGRTMIAWNDPHWVARRHQISGQDELLDTLAGALASFAAAGQ